MVADYEFEYAGLTFGGARDIGVLDVEGLSPPDSRAMVSERAEDHGAYIVADLLTHRTVTMKGDIVADTHENLESLLDSFRTAFAPRRDPEPLYVKFAGRDETLLINCVPVRRNWPYNVDYGLRSVTWDLQLLAGDPRMYSSTLNVITMTPAISAGVEFSIEFNVDFGGGAGGIDDANNAGTFDTIPVVRIDGPVTNPKITNVTQDKFIRVDLTLATGQYLLIDFADRTVMLNGSSSRYNRLSSDSEWWTLDAGANTIRFDGDATDESTQATVSWRDAWI